MFFFLLTFIFLSLTLTSFFFFVPFSLCSKLFSVSLLRFSTSNVVICLCDGGKKRKGDECVYYLLSNVSSVSFTSHTICSINESKFWPKNEVTGIRCWPLSHTKKEEKKPRDNRLKQYDEKKEKWSDSAESKVAAIPFVALSHFTYFRWNLRLLFRVRCQCYWENVKRTRRQRHREYHFASLRYLSFAFKLHTFTTLSMVNILVYFSFSVVVFFLWRFFRFSLSPTHDAIRLFGSESNVKNAQIYYIQLSSASNC